MSILKCLARACVRYGLKPEEIGPISTFSDTNYMEQYLGSMQSWEPPSFYGCTPKHRERAGRAWDKVLAQVEGDATKKGSNKSTRAPKPTPQKKARRRASVGQPRPVTGERPVDQEPEDGFNMAVLAPAETGVPLVVYILQDLGLIPDVRVEVAHNARGSRAETVKVAIRPTVRVTSGHLNADELALITRWIDINRDVLVKYWDGEIESTMDAIRALKPIDTA